MATRQIRQNSITQVKTNTTISSFVKGINTDQDNPSTANEEFRLLYNTSLDTTGSIAARYPFESDFVLPVEILSHNMPSNCYLDCLIKENQTDLNATIPVYIVYTSDKKPDNTYDNAFWVIYKNDMSYKKITSVSQIDVAFPYPLTNWFEFFNINKTYKYYNLNTFSSAPTPTVIQHLEPIVTLFKGLGILDTAAKFYATFNQPLGTQFSIKENITHKELFIIVSPIPRQYFIWNTGTVLRSTYNLLDNGGNNYVNFYTTANNDHIFLGLYQVPATFLPEHQLDPASITASKFQFIFNPVTATYSLFISSELFHSPNHNNGIIQNSAHAITVDGNPNVCTAINNGVEFQALLSIYDQTGQSQWIQPILLTQPYNNFAILSFNNGIKTETIETRNITIGSTFTILNITFQVIDATHFNNLTGGSEILEIKNFITPPTIKKLNDFSHDDDYVLMSEPVENNLNEYFQSFIPTMSFQGTEVSILSGDKIFTITNSALKRDDLPPYIEEVIPYAPRPGVLGSEGVGLQGLNALQRVGGIFTKDWQKTMVWYKESWSDSLKKLWQDYYDKYGMLDFGYFMGTNSFAINVSNNVFRYYEYVFLNTPYNLIESQNLIYQTKKEIEPSTSQIFYNNFQANILDADKLLENKDLQPNRFVSSLYVSLYSMPGFWNFIMKDGLFPLHQQNPSSNVLSYQIASSYTFPKSYIDFVNYKSNFSLSYVPLDRMLNYRTT